MRKDIVFFQVAFYALIILFLTACAKTPETEVAIEPPRSDNINQDSQNSGSADQVPDASVPAPSDGAQTSIREIQMTAKKFEFVPGTITAKRGEKILLTATSTDVDHGIAIPEFNVKADLPTGQPVTVEFTADKTGEFTIYCSKYCGSGHGAMKGKLIVTE